MRVGFSAVSDPIKLESSPLILGEISPSAALPFLCLYLEQERYDDDDDNSIQ